MPVRLLTTVTVVPGAGPVASLTTPVIVATSCCAKPTVVTPHIAPTRNSTTGNACLPMACPPSKRVDRWLAQAVVEARGHRPPADSTLGGECQAGRRGRRRGKLTRWRMPDESTRRASSGSEPAAADETNQAEDDRDDEQDVQRTAKRVLGDDAEQPEDDEDGDDGEHGRPPESDHNADAVSAKRDRFQRRRRCAIRVPGRTPRRIH